MENKMEIQKIDEFANLEESFTDLVKAGKDKEAIELVKTINSRLNHAITDWDKKIAPIRKALRKRERLEATEKRWKDYDKRLTNIKKHHADFYDEIYQDRGRDVNDIIKSWDCKGNEKFRCGNSSMGWNHIMEFCNFFTSKEEELHHHQWKDEHGIDNAFMKEHYPHHTFWMNNGEKLHLKDKHNSYLEVGVFLIDGQMQAKIGQRRYITHFSDDSLCRQCFPKQSICSKCQSPTTKDKCLFCQ